MNSMLLKFYSCGKFLDLFFQSELSKNIEQFCMDFQKHWHGLGITMFFGGISVSKALLCFGKFIVRIWAAVW